jgi:predicted RNase H-like HicB family nuclease
MPRVLDRPFDSAVLEKAGAIAHRYRIVLEPNDEFGYIGSSLEMPSVYNDGMTADACVKAVREALTVAVAYLIEKGEVPPSPANEQVRNKQVNVRVTEAEQRRLKEVARARGFSDVSEYLRSRSLCT